jgi:hypothetical protein
LVDSNKHLADQNLRRFKSSARSKCRVDIEVRCDTHVSMIRPDLRVNQHYDHFDSDALPTFRASELRSVCLIWSC